MDCAMTDREEIPMSTQAQSLSIIPSGPFAEPVEMAPAYRLYSLRAILLASIVGSPLAGSILMAVNYARLGKKANAALTLTLGLLGTVLVVMLAAQLPDGFMKGNIAIPMGLAFGTWRLAEALQGKALEDHADADGKFVSRWAAFGIGLAVCVPFLIAMLLPLFTEMLVLPTVTIGQNDKVAYSGSASKEEAEALGAALKQVGFFRDKGTTVRLSRDEKGILLCISVKEGKWDDAVFVAGIEQVGWKIAPAVGGPPIRIHLLDGTDKLRKELLIVNDRVMVGEKDVVIFSGNATQPEAEALGAALRRNGYFLDQGYEVRLNKKTQGKDAQEAVVTFEVRDGLWNEPRFVDAFRVIARDAAPAIGGFPVRVRLLDSHLAVQKEMLVRSGR
jgi:hypothetical protein